MIHGGSTSSSARHSGVPFRLPCLSFYRCSPLRPQVSLALHTPLLPLPGAHLPTKGPGPPQLLNKGFLPADRVVSFHRWPDTNDRLIQSPNIYWLFKKQYLFPAHQGIIKRNPGSSSRMQKVQKIKHRNSQLSNNHSSSRIFHSSLFSLALT